MKKQNKDPVSVFFNTQSVKDHIEQVVANRKTGPLADDIIDQGIFYCFTKNSDKSFDSVNKRINIFLKKVREGLWCIPQGWNGTSSQSIRENDEKVEREKKIQQQQDAQVFRTLTRGILSETGKDAINSMLQGLHCANSR